MCGKGFGSRLNLRSFLGVAWVLLIPNKHDVAFIILLIAVLAYIAYVKRAHIKQFLHRDSNSGRTPVGKNFQFMVYDEKSDVERGVWYRMKDWEYPSNYLRLEDPVKGRPCAVSPYEEKVMGTEFEDRWKNLVLLGDKPDFRLFLEREPNNKFDKNAIKVMCSATIDGSKMTRHLGYVQKETAAVLKGVDDIDVGSVSISFPTGTHPLILKIQIVYTSPSWTHEVDDS